MTALKDALAVRRLVRMRERSKRAQAMRASETPCDCPACRGRLGDPVALVLRAIAAGDEDETPLPKAH